MSQRLDVGEQVFPQVGDDPLPRLLQDDGLEVGAAHREQQDAGVDRHRRKQGGKGEVAHQHLLHIPHDEGRDDVVDDGEEHQHPRGGKAAEVGPGVMGQPADDLAVGDVPLKAHRSLFVLDGGIGEDQQGGHRPDQPPGQQQRVQFSHGCHLPVHLPAAADRPSCGSRRSGRTARRGRPRPPPARRR